MKILAINQFYAPDHSATSQMLSDLAEGLVSGGHEVTVIASRGGYLGGARLPARDILNGVHVQRPWATSFGKATVGARLCDYVSFWSSSVLRLIQERSPDVVLALTTPPMISAGAAMVAAARNTPLITWVQDVYPNVAAAFGLLRKGSITYRALTTMAQITHWRSARIVALSEDMANRLVSQGAPLERIRVIHNWSIGDEIRPIPHETNEFRSEHHLQGRFVAMYSGNLGVGHEFETFIDAARELQTQSPNVLFLFVGDGARRAEAQRRARGLGNVRFLPYQPKEILPQSLAAADVHLVSLRDGLEGLLVPSKVYGALATGRPILYIGPPASDVARIIDDANAGWCGRIGDVTGLVEALKAAAENRAWAITRGRNARTAHEMMYHKTLAIRRWCDLLQEIYPY